MNGQSTYRFMGFPDVRRRSGYLFVAVLLGHVLLISAQVNSRTGVPMLEAVTFGVFSEIQRAASSGTGTFRGFWVDYVALRQATVENVELRRQLGELQVKLQEQQALAAEGGRLRQLLDLRESTGLTTTAAQIVAGSSIPTFHTVTIDKGSRDGVDTDMAIIAPAGVVGRVVLPSPRAAKVQLLIDGNAAAGALLERSRAQGVVMGTGTERLRMEYVPATADVEDGDLVVTSGIDGIFPKGLVVGYVQSIEKTGTPYLVLWLRPAVDFSRLEEVLVVLAPTGRAEGVE
jgi:rod shape-determining protein MreC